MRSRFVLATLVAVGLVAALPGEVRSEPRGPAAAGQARTYVVLFRETASPARALAAVRRAGGHVVRLNRNVGVATVRSTDARFAARARQQRAIEGVAANRPIGSAPKATLERPLASATRSEATRALDRAAAAGGPGAPGNEPLAHLQWDMRMIHATALESHNVQAGDRGVRVGIIDTGIDGSHPDIAPNFDAALSRNFTVDRPDVDGPCEEEPDHSCNDPADVDEAGHGTHVAGTVGAAINGIGMAGVAPNVTLVNLRAGQDSGFFFLQPSVDALTYAGDHGVDVVNMSYFIDPWLFNCRANPADSPAAQQEQRTIIAATQRALRYAHAHGVTLVSSAGNQHLDLDNPTEDTTSPDYPLDAAYPRTIDNSCLTLPTEGKNVISVSSVGPSTAKADYSSWGLKGVDVAAPGGWFRDLFGTPAFRTNAGTQILAPWPRNVLTAEDIDPVTEEPLTDAYVRSCKAGTTTCGYYAWIQGTSMASPHAAGVAALIVSQYGKADATHGGLTLDPDRVERILKRTAMDHPCPNPATFSYENVGRPASWTATCTGTPEKNSFYGQGIVDALAAVLR